MENSNANVIKNDILKNLKILKALDENMEFLIEAEFCCECCDTTSNDFWIDIDTMIKAFEP